MRARGARQIGLWAALGLAACGEPSGPETSAPVEPAPPARGGRVLHLDRALDGARVESGRAPDAARQRREWDAAALARDWRSVASPNVPTLASLGRELEGDALRLSFARPRTPQGPLWIAGIATDLEGLRFDDWDAVYVRARSSDRFAGVSVAYNLDEEEALPSFRRFVMSPDEAPPLFNDGSLQTYVIPLRARPGPAPGALRSLAVLFAAPGTARVHLSSVALVPRGAAFLEDVGVAPVSRDGTTRRTLFAHTPASLAFAPALPPGARLDFGLAVERGQTVTYRVRVRGATAGEQGGDALLFEEPLSDSAGWQQRSVDLSELAGAPAELILEAESERPGAVALWGAPVLTLAAARAPGGSRPNIVFYVIDGGDANLMSLYGYDRPTTPYLEELAREGFSFTRAHSNSTWTQPSTVSFMTSLQHSVLGGLRRGVHSTSVPPEARTLAEHLRDAGYQTASFTSNPNAGRIIGVDRGFDVVRDVETGNHSTSSIELQERFFAWRDAYPGGPYFVHFQTTDVHEPNRPEPPFSGRVVSEAQREQLDAWDQEMDEAAGHRFGTTSIAGYYDLALAETGIDRRAYFETRRGLYDETMMHQDQALRRFVAALEERGEWRDTLLVIASDHGHPAGTFARFGRGLLDPQPEPWQGALFDAYASRVPLLFVWPGTVEGARRSDAPVSMVDVLPTLLDLVGLPQPEMRQGQSLAPLLRGQEMAVRPVILDEFRFDETSGQMVGNLEIIDGRWGASLEIGPVSEGADPELGRHSAPAGGRWGAVHPYFPEVPRLLLYDLEADPFARRAVNDQHPELVTHYRDLLLEQWEAHRALAESFDDEVEETPMTPEQLNQLRALGYIQ